MLQGAWKLKHKQKLEEVEAEEEAAESQDISEDAQEPVPEALQPVSRPMRAIRAPRYAAIERTDVLPTRSSRDTETGSPPTPLRRAGRGGSLPLPPPTNFTCAADVQLLAHMQRVADTATPMCGHDQRRLLVAPLAIASAPGRCCLHVTSLPPCLRAYCCQKCKVKRLGHAGRGRWANHVKRGNGRGLRPMPTPSPQDTPHAAKAGGRGRRGGGRWGNRAQPKPDQAEDICICAFGGLVNALDNKAAGLPFAGFPSLLQVLPVNPHQTAFMCQPQTLSKNANHP